MAKPDVKKLLQRAKQVQKGQQLWHTLWDDLARVHVPRLLGFTTSITEGMSRNDDVFDGTPMHAARGLANTLGGLLRPEGEQWVTIRAQDSALNDHDEARRWFEFASNRLHEALHNPAARMRQALGEVDLMLTVFGTGPLWVGESSRRNSLLFQAIPLRDAAVDWDEEGAPLAFYRTRRLNVRQAEEAFGRKNLGQKAEELFRSEDWDTKLTYIHMVMPRRDRLVTGRLARNLPIASYWVEEESEHIVQESGFHEFPYVIPRMETAPGEDYGRSPAMVSLPDANTLQSMGESLLIAGQRAAEPPIFAPNDGSFTEANTFPGGISYYDVELASKIRGNPIFPLETGHNLPLTRDMQRDTREQVYAAFFRHVLNLPVAGPRMTATEVIERREEMIREVGPMFGRLESDYTAPVVERAFNVMLRAGLFHPIPEVLAGRDVQFEYASPVKRTRKMIEAAASRMFRDEIFQLVQLDPSAADHFDVDEYVRVIADTGNAPMRLLRRPDRVEEIRKARAEQQAREQEQAQAMMAAEQQRTEADAMGKLGKAAQGFGAAQAGPEPAAQG